MLGEETDKVDVLISIPMRNYVMTGNNLFKSIQNRERGSEVNKIDITSLDDPAHHQSLN